MAADLLRSEHLENETHYLSNPIKCCMSKLPLVKKVPRRPKEMITYCNFFSVHEFLCSKVNY